MTVLAWDGVTLAADKRMVTAGGICRTVTKIKRVRPLGAGTQRCLAGITGALDTALEMLAWYEAGALPMAFPAEARKDVATLVLIVPDGNNVRILNWCSGPIPVEVEVQQMAWGSGRDYAEAVMYLSLDARRAVQVACHFQSDCGNGIDALRLHE